MCGITGFFNKDIDGDRVVPTIKDMLSQIIHRGPDEMGYMVDNHLAMGTARLSIIDLVSGQQPMSDSTGRYWLTYNGEVYNYKELKSELQDEGVGFTTTSDTEVVLQAWIAWGSDAFKKFNGAFSLAIYDRQDRKLILCRDRYGKRPLFIHQSDRGILFASEMKCFLAYPGFNFEFDSEQLTSIFQCWTPLPDQSAYKDVQQLPQGSYLEITEQGLKLNYYYKLDFSVEQFSGTEQEAIKETRRQLSDSVKLRLRSDVEVGTYLSGGLDSSITTLLALENGAKNVNTFSVSFSDPDFDESREQKLVSDFLGTRHTSVHITSKDISQALPDALLHSEVPVFRTAFVPMYLLSSKVKQAGIKVVLTGEGADESFLGYNIFKETLLRAEWNNISSEDERVNRIQNLYPYLKHFNQQNARALLAHYSKYTEEVTPGLFSHELRYNNSNMSLRMLKDKSFTKSISALVEQEKDLFSHFNLIEKAQWLEFNTLLSGYLLSTQGDRMSLANNVENRCPFLDQAVVHWAASIPHAMKLKNGDEKYLLKKAFESDLPKEITARPKIPYRAPDAAALLDNKEQDYLELITSESELSNISCLDSKFCQRFVNKIFATQPDKISPKDNQAFIMLISMALLNYYYVNKQAYRPVNIDNLLVNKIDLRHDGCLS